MHEPRGKNAVGLGYALSDTGADHMMAAHDTSLHTKGSVSLRELAPLGVLEPIDLFDLGPRKARAYYYAESVWTLWKVLGICIFAYAPRTWQPLDHFVQIFEAITGWDTSMWELMKVAERASALSRVFNARCGFGPKDDWLPQRFFEPLQGGALQGRKISETDYQAALDLVYQMKGWDTATGSPTRAKLLELDLEWLAELVGNR